MHTVGSFRDILKGVFEQRSQRNSRYSLRSFARDLGMSSSRLSEVMSGRYGLSAEAAKPMAARLGLTSQETEWFCDLVESQHGRSKARRELAKKRLEAQRPVAGEGAAFRDLTADAFKIISDWYHYAILELTCLKDFKSDSRWMASRLGLNELVVRQAIERLLRLELLEEKNGKLRATEDFNSSPSGVPSDALRKFHRQILEKAMDAVHLQGVDRRDLSAMVLAIDPADLPQAREELKTFRRKFSADRNAATRKSAVYCLSMQFFELTENS